VTRRWRRCIPALLVAEQPSPRRSLLADLRPLRESPPFRRLWIGTSVSSLGGAMTGFAVILQTYDLTHSSVAVGAIGLAQAIPSLVIGLFGGSFADAVDRRRLVLATSGILAAVSAVFAVQAFLALGQLWLLYVLAAVQATVQSVDGPARRTFLPRLLPAERVAAGVALGQLSGYVSFLGGSVLAGAVTAAAGLRVCYLIDALSFGAALYGVGRLPAMPPQHGQARPGFRAAAEGLRYIRRQPVLTAAFLADIDATLLGMPVALFPALNAERFGGSPQTLGLLNAALAAGGLLGSALSGPAARVSGKGRAMLITVAIWGAAIAGFGFARVLWLALGLLALAGAADTTSVIFRGSVVQAITPDRLRGRVTAVDYVVGVGVPRLGNFEAGAVASLTSPAISAVSGGLATMAGAVAIRLAFPAMARYGAPGEPAATCSPRPEDPDAMRGDARGEQRPGKS
jgi:MFS family permease